MLIPHLVRDCNSRHEIAANDNQRLPSRPAKSAFKSIVVSAYCFGLVSVRIAQSLIDAVNAREA